MNNENNFNQEVSNNETNNFNAMNNNYDNTHIVFGNRVAIFNQVNGVYTVFGENINYNSDNNYLLMFANELNISGRILDGAILGKSACCNGGILQRGDSVHNCFSLDF